MRYRECVGGVNAYTFFYQPSISYFPLSVVTKIGQVPIILLWCRPSRLSRTENRMLTLTRDDLCHSNTYRLTSYLKNRLTTLQRTANLNPNTDEKNGIYNLSFGFRGKSGL